MTSSESVRYQILSASSVKATFLGLLWFLEVNRRFRDALLAIALMVADLWNVGNFLYHVHDKFLP